jgi:hypothetical protein
MFSIVPRLAFLYEMTRFTTLVRFTTLFRFTTLLVTKNQASCIALYQFLGCFIGLLSSECCFLAWHNLESWRWRQNIPPKRRLPFKVSRVGTCILKKTELHTNGPERNPRPAKYCPLVCDPLRSKVLNLTISLHIRNDEFSAQRPLHVCLR